MNQAMKRLIVVLALSAFVFSQCTSTNKAAAIPVAGITYAAHVQPVIIANCSPCHLPPKGFKTALDTYGASKDYIDDIIRRISLSPGDKGFMPFKHEKLSDSIIHIFKQWKTGGLRES
jgi:hypothetical protein